MCMSLINTRIFWKQHYISPCYMQLYLFDTKKLLSLIKLTIEKPGSKTVPLRGAATNLRAIHLSIVYAFRYFVAKRWKIWKQQISALYMLFQLLATTWRAADLTSLYGSYIFSSKKLAKKKHLKSLKCIQFRMLAAATGGSLRGPNLRFVYGFCIFYMRLGRWHPDLPPRRGFVCRTGRHSCEGSDGGRRP